MTYFGSAACSRTIFHFVPVGKPAPPIPFRPLCSSTGTGSPVKERSTR
jgi:hypothetical protein